MSFDQLTSIVSKQIKAADGKLKSGSESFDWVNLKRAPQILKKRAHIGVNTEDAEFDDLKSRLCLAERVFVDISKYTQMFITATGELLALQDLATINLALLFDTNLDVNTDTEIAINATMLKLQAFREISPVITQLMENLNLRIETRIKEALGPIKCIQKKIRAREGALLDYDQAFNSRQSLLAKKPAAELTTKQSHYLFGLERKLADHKMKYGELNELLKHELPVFLELLLLLIGQLLVVLHDSQHCIIREICKGVEPLGYDLADVLHCPMIEFSQHLVKDVDYITRQCDQEFASLAIFKKVGTQPIDHESGLVKVTPSVEAKFCRATFSFRAQQAGDLSFEKDCVIKILEDNGNWWKGQLDGNVGIFPANYVTTDI